MRVCPIVFLSHRRRIWHGRALLLELRKTLGDCFGDVFAAASNEIYMPQAFLDNRVIQLREPLALHMQADLALGIECPDYRSKLRVIHDVYHIALKTLGSAPHLHRIAQVVPGRRKLRHTVSPRAHGGGSAAGSAMELVEAAVQSCGGVDISNALVCCRSALEE